MDLDLGFPSQLLPRAVPERPPPSPSQQISSERLLGARPCTPGPSLSVLTPALQWGRVEGAPSAGPSELSGGSALSGFSWVAPRPPFTQLRPPRLAPPSGHAGRGAPWRQEAAHSSPLRLRAEPARRPRPPGSPRLPRPPSHFPRRWPALSPETVRPRVTQGFP